MPILKVPQMYFVHIFSHTRQAGYKAQAFLHLYTNKKDIFQKPPTWNSNKNSTKGEEADYKDSM